ncbi:MAG: dockerin type I domain-containing protein [Phycisphaerae bacterium]
MNLIRVVLLAGALASAGGAARPETGAAAASPFASSVESYYAGFGAGQYTFSSTALGPPSVDTDPDQDSMWEIDPVAVVPVFPAWRTDQVVTVAPGGHLTLAFDHKVVDDPMNRYGVDLTVFGNSALATADTRWDNTDPADFSVQPSSSREAGRVLVSQDGTTWHELDTVADGFYPTLGRTYDPADPDLSMGDWNHWWGEPTDPTLPMDPALGPEQFAGMTLEEVCLQYGRSAGGRGLDLANLPESWADPLTGNKWIRYVRFETPATIYDSPEIDALADAAVHGLTPGDVDASGTVDFSDAWAVLAHYRSPADTFGWADGDFNGDGRVNDADIQLLLDNYSPDAAVSVATVAGAFAVPEPGMLLMLTVAGVLLPRRRA